MKPGARTALANRLFFALSLFALFDFFLVGDQAFLFVHLPFAELVYLASEGVDAAFEFYAGYTATMRVENVFSLIFVSIGNAVSPYVSQNLGAKKIDRIKKGYHAALVLDLCFAVLAFLVIETLHTQISSLFLGKDGTAFAYQVSGDYMRWIGYFFIFMGIKMATDGVLRGLGIMRPFLVANIVNLAIRLSVALICAPRFGIAFVWLAVPAAQKLI